MSNAFVDPLSRRASLATLGVAGFAALGRPVGAAAKKSGKKKCKNKTQNDRCPAQAEDCSTFIAGVCAGDPACLAQVACCDFLAECNASGFFVCLGN